MQDEINEKVVALSIKGTKLTAALLQKAIKILLAEMKKQQGKQPQGKQTLKQLNLTKRQIICFAAALITGLPLFFLLKGSSGTSLAAFVMILVMLPCFLFAMYEKHGQPLEVLVKNIIQTKFIRPKERPYQTQNLYAALERQQTLEKEVAAIVTGKNKTPTSRRG